MPSQAGFVPVPASQENNPTARISSIDPTLTRTNYFDGRLLRASDLIRDQLYLDERLRQVGRVLGQGVVHGFDTALGQNGVLTIMPGLAVAPSGRVVELMIEPGADGTVTPVSVNLFDRANLQALNPDGFERLGTGLYVLAVTHAVSEAGSAEVFPADLSGERGFHHNVTEDGVQFLLAPLAVGLQNTLKRLTTSFLPVLPGSTFFLRQRAALARELLANPGQPAGIGDDAVALAAIAIFNGQPIWLDEWLVRRAHRETGSPHQWQRDLFNHYDALLNEVLEIRDDGFRAESHFELLPPAGRMPVAGVDPENGLQAFFPEHFHVEIAPVRQDDLPSLLDEAAALDPIDLASDLPADVVVLAPLNDIAFARFGRQLEFDPKGFADREAAYAEAQAAFEAAAQNSNVTPDQLALLKATLDDYERYFAAKAGYIAERLPSLDTLPLTTRPIGPAQALDTDARVWRDIQASIQASGELWYMRRPPRTAETGVAAIMLARGYQTPEPGTDPGDDSEILRQQLVVAAVGLADAKARADDLEAQVEALTEQLNNASDADLAEAQRKIAKLEADLQAAEGTAALVPDLQARRTELEGQLTLAQKKIDELNQAIADNREVQELKDQIERLQDERDRLTQANEQLSQKLKSLDVDLAVLIESRRLEEAKVKEAASVVAEALRDRPDAGRRIVEAIALLPLPPDSPIEFALWRTLLEVAERKRLDNFVAGLRDLRDVRPVGGAVRQLALDLGVSPATANLWSQDDGRPGGRGTVTGGLIDTRFERFRVVTPFVAPTSIDDVGVLADRRNITTNAIRRSVRAVDGVVRNDQPSLELVNDAAAAVPEHYDEVFWTTIERVIEKRRLETFVGIARKARDSGQSVGLAIAAHAAELGLTADQRKAWVALDLERQ